jgi:hypothetical protein
MKRFALALLLLTCATPAFAWDDNDPRAWTTVDIFMESAILTVAGVATLQATALMEKGESISEGYYTSDSVEVVGYTAAAVVGHAVVAHFLPPPYRRGWQCLGLGAAAGYLGFVFSQPMP